MYFVLFFFHLTLAKMPQKFEHLILKSWEYTLIIWIYDRYKNEIVYLNQLVVSKEKLECRKHIIIVKHIFNNFVNWSHEHTLQLEDAWRHLLQLLTLRNGNALAIIAHTVSCIEIQLKSHGSREDSKILKIIHPSL